MNRGGGKFLRPGTSGGQPSLSESSDDSDDDFGQDEEEEMPPPQPPKKSSANANLSSSENDDNDDDEEEENEDDYNEKSNKRARSNDREGRSKSKKAKPSFFDEEAEASDDDEEEEDEYGTHRDPHDRVKKFYTEDDIRRENMDEEVLAIINRQNRRRNQLAKFTREDDVEDIARQIEERHRMASRRIDRTVLDDSSMVDGNQNISAVTQQSLLPSVSDPSLWMVGCANGKEEELVYQIMNKCIAHARKGKPLGITSAIAAQSKGRIYIESFSEPAVREAIQGVRELLAYKLRLVPINDMTTVMTVIPKNKPVKKNDWVRLTRSHYKGDLALVRAVRESGTKCVIQCVPRLDLTLSDLPPEEAKIRRKTVKPPQKFYNPQEVASLGKQSAIRQRFPGMGDLYCDYFEGNYYHDGYLLKEVNVGTMVKPCGEDEPPTLDELQRFRNRNKNDSSYDGYEENEGSKIAKSLLDELSELQGKTNLGKDVKNSGGLVIGDNIEVIEGDLVGMSGKLMSIDGSTVRVKPTGINDLGGTTEVEFLISQVRKHIPIGAHVKIIEGRYANETGVVVAIEKLEGEIDATAVILTDMTHKEVSVRVSQVQESAEVATGQDKLAGYELHDLVVLSGGGSANEVGVIVRVGHEEFSVINNHGIVREVRPEELRGKRNSSSGRSVALDVQGNQIRVGDTVSVTEGPHKGKTATIKRMNRAQLFLYSQTRAENAGIFVVRSRSCVLSGSNAQARKVADVGSSPFSTPQSQQRGPTGGAVRGRQNDGIIGKTVRIQAGNWKGYLGAVADATPTHVQVELHSRLKKVMVLRDRVVVVGDKYGATEDADRLNTNIMLAPTTPFLGGATPMHGGATPMHGGATPMYGGATPMHGQLSAGFATPLHQSGDNDDVWRPGGAIDRTGEPVHNNDDFGWGSNNTSNQNDAPPARDGGWGSSSNGQADSTWIPSANEDANVNNNFATDKVPKEETEFDNIGASTMGADDGQQAPVWFMERVYVQLKNDKIAVIKDITGNKAVVELEDKSSQTVSCGECIMVPPKENDTVLVTGGADVGVEGELVCIDGSDAILRDAQGDFKIVDLVHIAKIDGES
mmetsp:Transcript_15429/g.29098  ORF Transcript_15429/g.29098 Transcript_15429/m.29098 type:complete len:1091 (-) Transcript_15429:67-3339(-)